jgi:hypothetical protein
LKQELGTNYFLPKRKKRKGEKQEQDEEKLLTRDSS